jgi:hypothetical protein
VAKFTGQSAAIEPAETKTPAWSSAEFGNEQRRSDLKHAQEIMPRVQVVGLAVFFPIAKCDK